MSTRGLVSLEAPDTYVNDEDGLLRQLLSQPACSFAEVVMSSADP